MKTRCPSCATAFRVTPEQLKARNGKVRCGQCQSVFNALDHLLEEIAPTSAISPANTPLLRETEAIVHEAINAADNAADILPETAPEPEITIPPQSTAHTTAHAESLSPPLPPPLTAPLIEPSIKPQIEPVNEPLAEPLSEEAAQNLAKTAGLIIPRDTTEIPGYSKWAEGGISSPSLPPSGRNPQWLFTAAALLLTLTLSGQLIFHFRSAIAVTAPSLRPALETLSDALGASVPLPHHVELVSIETSDLQADPTHSNLLILQATLRNRAPYGQAYPLLELSLTDTQDSAIARRVFQADEYLSAENPSDQPFPANTDVAVRLWIEAKEISAAGYRLYAFYP